MVKKVSFVGFRGVGGDRPKRPPRSALDYNLDGELFTWQPRDAALSISQSQDLRWLRLYQARSTNISNHSLVQVSWPCDAFPDLLRFVAVWSFIACWGESKCWSSRITAFCLVI